MRNAFNSFFFPLTICLMTLAGRNCHHLLVPHFPYDPTLLTPLPVHIHYAYRGRFSCPDAWHVASDTRMAVGARAGERLLHCWLFYELAEKQPKAFGRQASSLSLWLGPLQICCKIDCIANPHTLTRIQTALVALVSHQKMAHGCT